MTIVEDRATMRKVLTFLFTVVVFAVMISGMMVGLAVAGKRLRGSCGGTGVGCSCSPEKQARCKKPTPHAETPIEASSLTRKSSS